MSNEADGRFFKAGVFFGVVGLIFFSISLHAIFQTHNNKYKFFTENLDKKTNEINTTINEVNTSIEKVVRTVSKTDSSSKTDYSTHLIALNYDFNNLIYEVKQHLHGINNQFYIVSLLAGSFLEIIAIMNFYQYGKAVSQLQNLEFTYKEKEHLWNLAQQSCEIKDSSCMKSMLEILSEEHHNSSNPNKVEETSAANGKKS